MENWKSALSEVEIGSLLDSFSLPLPERKRFERKMMMRGWVRTHPENMAALLANRRHKYKTSAEFRAKILSACRAWKLKNPECKRASYHRNKHKHAKRISERGAIYYKKNRDSCLARSMAYNRKRLLSDPAFRLLAATRSRIRGIIKYRNPWPNTLDIIGCDKSQFLSHMESRFTHGMSWDNYGLSGWHIDHIVPCSSFDLSNREELLKCFHYTNLQPLWAKDNLMKADSVMS